MIKTFSFESKISETMFRYTIYAVDLGTSIKIWLDKIYLLRDEVHSFSSEQVKSIIFQFESGEAKIHIDQKPFYIAFKINDQIQICYIHEHNIIQPDFIAITKYLKSEEGGRQYNVFSGFRPQVKFEGFNILTSGEQLFVEKDIVFPGDTITAEIRLLSVNTFIGQLYSGLKFDLCEGQTTIAKGHIINVINDKLNKFDLK